MDGDVDMGRSKAPRVGQDGKAEEEKQQAEHAAALGIKQAVMNLQKLALHTQSQTRELVASMWTTWLAPPGLHLCQVAVGAGAAVGVVAVVRLMGAAGGCCQRRLRCCVATR